MRLYAVYAVALIAILLLPLLSAENDDLYNYDTVNTELSISSKIRLEPKYSGAQAEYVHATLNLVPDGRDTLMRSTEPEATGRDEKLVYEWNSPEENLVFSLSAILQTSLNQPVINTKIPFPTSFTDDLHLYTRPSKHIDSDNPSIREKASELADGQDDLFVVLFKLANWTEQNIKYNISTLTVDTSQKASWVLQNRIGVCDELTSLFIAMARSLGIPARFISGISYTNAPYFRDQWQPHGWAEVYLPNKGWVPFDPTFGEFGYVDATHIRLQESIDPDEPAIRYEWLGDVNLDADQLSITTKLVKTGKKLPPDVEIKSAPARDNVGFGSYNIITTKIENLRNSYVATTLRAGTPHEVTISPTRTSILLKPRERKNVYWLIKLSDNLQTGYTYTIPVVVATERNITSTAEVKATERGTVYDRNDVLAFMRAEDEERHPSPKITFSCTIDNSTLINTTISAFCTIKNTGNTVMQDISICIQDQCSVASLQLNEEKSVGKSFPALRTGNFEAVIKLRGPELQKTIFLPYKVRDRPSLTTKKITAPDTVRFRGAAKIQFSIEPTSFTLPQDVVVSTDLSPHFFRIKELREPQEVAFTIDSTYLNEGGNEITFTTLWHDGDGTAYQEKTNIDIVLEPLTFMQKIESFFYRLTRFFS